MGGAPRTKILEDRLRRARQMISQLQAENPSIRHRSEVDGIFETPPGSPESESTSRGPDDEEDSPAGALENMMDGQGRFTSAGNDNVAYFGGPSGFAFLQRTQQLFGDRTDERTPSQPPSPQHTALTHLFDTPLPDKQALSSNVPISHLLPSRDTATRLLHIVFEQTHQLFQFLDEPSFHEAANRIYDTDPIEFTDSDHDFLPLFFAVMAIGYLFDPERHQKYGCRRTIDQAMRHFIAARQMIDVTRCHDLIALQTVLCFVLFLMSTARLATAHTYVALAAAAAMRMGLHAQTSTTGDFPQEEKDARRRIFWTIVKLDIYTGTILGLPGLVNLSHVDQIRPSGSVSDYNAPSSSPTKPDATKRMLAASAQYLDLLLIVARMVSRLYPKTENEARQVRKSKRMMINNTVIAEIEAEYKAWRDHLPTALGATDEGPSSALTSITYELEMAHNLAHILLYRPFLHYLARMKGENPPDSRQLRCAASCIKISRITITRSHEILQQGFLAPAAWQSVYTIFLAIVVLIFFLATQHGASDYVTVQHEAEMGIKVLAGTSCQDIGSRRCLDVLKVLTRRLSHMMELDIENIERNVKSYCRFELAHQGDDLLSHGTPVVVPKPAPSNSASSQQSRRERPVPTNILPSQRHDSVSTQAQSRHNSTAGAPMYYQQPTFVDHLPVQTPQHQQGYFDGTPQGYQPHRHHSHSDYHHSHEDMEVPFTNAFAWPFDPTAVTAEEVHGSTGVPSSSNPYPNANHALTSEDIAAFMRINPGEEPFL